MSAGIRGSFRDKISNDSDDDNDDNDMLSKRKRDNSSNDNNNDNNTSNNNSNDCSNDTTNNITKKRNITIPFNENNPNTNAAIPSFQSKSSSSSSVFSDKETDPQKIAGRLKQIQFGKNTKGYDNYIMSVPIQQRVNNPKIHPRTPDPYLKQSKRAFDGRLRQWRRILHDWDTKGVNSNIFGQNNNTFDSIVQTHKNSIAAIALTKQTLLHTEINDLLDNFDYMEATQTNSSNSCSSSRSSSSISSSSSSHIINGNEEAKVSNDDDNCDVKVKIESNDNNESNVDDVDDVVDDDDDVL
jgi:hypothetical protein